MIVKRLKLFISRAKNRDNSTQDNTDDHFPDLVTTNNRIQANTEISPNMKKLADRLLNSYLPLITLNYQACANSSKPKANDIGRDIFDLYDGICSHVADCLLDIENGAQFEDRFSDVFLSNLLNFESVVEFQNQKNCR